MSKHQATEQMLGYLYQVRYALLLLLNHEDEQAQISIEQLDDVTFETNNNKDLVQLKHHVNDERLSDASNDLWRTIKVWVDLAESDPSILNNTRFIIATTAKSSDNSAASLLKNSNRDEDKAYNILLNIAQTSKNQNHRDFYSAFINFGDNGKILIKNVLVLDQSYKITEIESQIKKLLRYGTLPKHENSIYEKLVGWWDNIIIEHLYDKSVSVINQKQIREKIRSIADEYTDDNLPIDIEVDKSIDINDIPIAEQVFYEQLKLICLGSQRLKIALIDYYQAFTQRASWMRNDLLYIDELSEYEKRLVDEWERVFYRIHEELGENYDDSVKVTMGKNVYNTVQDKDIRIRDRCSALFVMRGSYHILANELKVGWHCEFQARLQELLSGVGRGQLE